MTPTHSLYRYLEDAYAHFNHALFGGQLPVCLLTVQREKNVMGYFSANRWTDDAGNNVHELAVNPTYFARHNLLEVFQTLVHEMVHNWQHSCGSPSRGGYHNKEWAAKMERIGLIPSSTGMRGGKKTGQRMSDYPAPGGPFERAATAFIRKSRGIPWVDRFAATTPSCQPRETEYAPPAELAVEATADTESEDIDALLHVRLSEVFEDLVPEEQMLAARRKVKIRYSCPSCRTNVWGKAGLKLMCGECGSVYEPNDME